MPGRERGVILLVEDDDGLREAFVWALREGGYRVASVPDGRAAMRWLGQHVTPALVLLDLWLPGIDGWQVRQEIESHAHLRAIPIIVVTAAQDQKAELLNVRAVLQKPVTVSNLLAAVEQHI